MLLFMSQQADSLGSVNLGIISMEAAPGWRFFPLADRVVGRPDSGVGGIQVVRIPIEQVSWPASHEICMGTAVKASGYAVQGVGADRARETSEFCSAGGESFLVGDDFVRIWYRHCPDGMVAAWFAVNNERARERGVKDSISQADQMVSTVRVPPPMV